MIAATTFDLEKKICKGSRSHLEFTNFNVAQTLGINKMADNTTSETTGSKVGLILHILAHFLSTELCLRKLSHPTKPQSFEFDEWEGLFHCSPFSFFYV